MSKTTVASKMLAYLKHEEEYLRDLRRFIEHELFRLQIEELNLSAALRTHRVKAAKLKLEEEEEESKGQNTVHHKTESPALSARQKLIKFEEVPSAVFSVPLTEPPLEDLEPLNLEPNLESGMDSDED